MITKRNPDGTIAANGILRKYFSIEEARAGKKISLRLWKERNINKIREYRKKYRFLNKKVSFKIRQEVYERNISFYKKLTCVYCRVHLPFGYAEIDHIVPVSKNGTNKIENLCVSCKECNQRKSIKSTREFKNTAQSKKVYSLPGGLLFINHNV